MGMSKYSISKKEAELYSIEKDDHWAEIVLHQEKNSRNELSGSFFAVSSMGNFSHLWRPGECGKATSLKQLLQNVSPEYLKNTIGSTYPEVVNWKETKDSFLRDFNKRDASQKSIKDQIQKSLESIENKFPICPSYRFLSMVERESSIVDILGWEQTRYLMKETSHPQFQLFLDEIMPGFVEQITLEDPKIKEVRVDVDKIDLNLEI